VASYAPTPCAQCRVTIPPEEDARLCDVDTCGTWLVCRGCAPEALDSTPLRCVAHQLGRVQAPVDAATPLERLTKTQPESIGRLLARLMARCAGLSPPQISASPFSIFKKVSKLRMAADEASGSVWTTARTKAVDGPIFRLWSLAIIHDALDEPAFPDGLSDLCASYVARRLDAPLVGWPLCKAKQCGADLSSLASAIRLDTGLPVLSFCGALPRSLIATRGGFQRKDHSASYPLTPFMLMSVEHLVSPAERQTFDMGLFQSLAGARPGIAPQVKRHMLGHR
jgi:hypothetical protein